MQNYLAQYGYLPPINPENGAFLSEEKLTAAIEEFQAFGGLNITGMLYVYYLSFLNFKHYVGESSDCAKFITGSDWWMYPHRWLTQKITKDAFIQCRQYLCDSKIKKKGRIAKCVKL